MMSLDNRTQPRQLEEISRNTWSGARALQTISRNSRASLINRGLLLGLALLAIDALIVSDFQPQVALAVLRESSWMTVFVGTLINLLPVIVPAIGTVLLVFGAMKLCSSEPSDGFVKTVQSFIVFAVAWFCLDRELVWSPWVMIPVFLVVTIAALIIGDKFGFSEGTEQFAGLIMMGTFLAAMALTLTNSAVSGALARPYVPAEVITVQSSDNARESVIGYVLSVDPSGQWTTMLIDEDRRIEHIPSSQVIQREICEPGNLAQFTPWWTLFVRGVDFSDERVLTQVPTGRDASNILACVAD